ncbi:MAG: hypothetical protein ONB48_20985 [candidate division KSB1 bacterium]|nr:hypothetical protein [candidate division KSB1 bacterium]MDZ7276455.1 hypothetical protein [candidate division KSB1 bacterium]MDZ7288124.1 hypothetical protein [candidate division KSB1 bacterium]MDZ7300225.1 hypothetical protein [candidate division KSB1 bacterium]MDZ7309130.1 hypothetical protein [candidate division KSB1 bacterium]
MNWLKRKSSMCPLGMGSSCVPKEAMNKQGAGGLFFQSLQGAGMGWQKRQLFTCEKISGEIFQHCETL